MKIVAGQDGPELHLYATNDIPQNAEVLYDYQLSKGYQFPDPPEYIIHHHHDQRSGLQAKGNKAVFDSENGIEGEENEHSFDSIVMSVVEHDQDIGLSKAEKNEHVADSQDMLSSQKAIGDQDQRSGLQAKENDAVLDFENGSEGEESEHSVDSIVPSVVEHDQDIGLSKAEKNEHVADSQDMLSSQKAIDDHDQRSGLQAKGNEVIFDLMNGSEGEESEHGVDLMHCMEIVAKSIAENDKDIGLSKPVNNEPVADSQDMLSSQKDDQDQKSGLQAKGNEVNEFLIQRMVV